MTQKVLLALLTGSAVLFSGCATILSDKQQQINLISSKPRVVEINGQTFNAPNIVTLQRPSTNGILKVSDCNKTIMMEKVINPMFYVNILFIYGTSTDLSTGALWKYDQTNINVDCN